MSPELNIQARNMEVTDRINDYIEKKASKLDRFLSAIEETRVELTFEKSARSAADRHVAQITVRGKNLLLRSEERADDIFAAFDAAMDKIQRQIDRYKGKRYRGRGDGRSALESPKHTPCCAACRISRYMLSASRYRPPQGQFQSAISCIL